MLTWGNFIGSLVAELTQREGFQRVKLGLTRKVPKLHAKFQGQFGREFTTPAWCVLVLWATLLYLSLGCLAPSRPQRTVIGVAVMCAV